MKSSANATLVELIIQAMDQAAEQPHSQFGDMGLVQLEPTFGFLPVNPSLSNTSILAPAIGQFFLEPTFALPQVRAYAISDKHEKVLDCRLLLLKYIL